MNALRMTHEIRPCMMLEGIPLRLMLTAANQRTQERIRIEAESRSFTDTDLTDGERLFGTAVNS